MDIDHRSKFFCTKHQSCKHSVIYHHSFFFVNKEAFETCDTFSNCLFHFFKDLTFI